MILSSSTEYFCVKEIDGVLKYLSLVSFKYIELVQYGVGVNSKEDLQFYLNNYTLNETLKGSKIVSVTTTKTLKEI